MWRVFLKVAVSATLVTWLLWRTPVSDIGSRLSALDAKTVVGGLVLSIASWWISAVRLWFLAPEFSLRAIVRETFIALYYGTVLPGQMAGDVIKAYRLSHAQSGPGQAVGATLVDRVVAMFALFLIGACVVPRVEQAPRALSVLLPLAAAGILIGMLVLALPRVHTLCSRRLRISQPSGLAVLLGRLVDGLHGVLQHPLRLFACFMLALIFHGFCVAIHLVLAQGLGIELPIAAWFLAYAGVALLTLMPISIAGLGLRESGYVGLLAMVGVAATQALSLSLVLFAYILFGAMLGWIVELSDRQTR